MFKTAIAFSLGILLGLAVMTAMVRFTISIHDAELVNNVLEECNR